MPESLLTYRVFFKQLDVDDWIEDTEIRVHSLSFVVAPGIKTCRMSKEYGLITRSGVGETVLPLDLKGKLIRVIMTNVDEPPIQETWFGYCPTTEESVDHTFQHPDVTANPGVLVDSGRVDFICYGLEFYLQQHRISKSTTNIGIVSSVLVFNSTSKTRSNEIQGNKIIAAAPSLFQFAETGTDRWTARDVVEYLLNKFNNEFGTFFVIGGETNILDALDEYIDVWDFAGLKYWDALSRVISADRGYLFYVRGDTLFIDTITDTDIKQGATVIIPTNSDVLSVNVTGNPGIKTVKINNLENNHFDKIRVEGGRIRVMFTISEANQTLAENWTASDKTAYKNANDEQRKQFLFQNVYQSFKIPDGWDGLANGHRVFIQVDETTGQVKNDLDYVAIVYHRNLVLDRSIPIFTENTNQLSLMRVWIRDTTDNTYHRVDKPGKLFKSSSIRALDDDLGFVLESKYNHFMGLNDFDGTSADLPVFDSIQLIATVSMHINERMVYEVNALDPEPGEIEKIKTIQIPEAQFWFTVEDTVLEANETGLTFSFADIERSDFDTLKLIGDLAQSWYGKRKAKISIEYNDLFIIDFIGKVLKETNAGGSIEPAGTPITSVVYNFDATSVSFDTEYRDLNLKVFGRRISTISSERQRQIETDYENPPIRTGVPSEGGTGGQVLLKVVSKISGTRYNVEVFGDGPGEAKTADAIVDFINISDASIVESGNFFFGQILSDSTDYVSTDAGTWL